MMRFGNLIRTAEIETTADPDWCTGIIA